VWRPDPSGSSFFCSPAGSTRIRVGREGVEPQSFRGGSSPHLRAHRHPAAIGIGVVLALAFTWLGLAIAYYSPHP
jgi:hypothetical protein